MRMSDSNVVTQNRVNLEFTAGDDTDQKRKIES